MSSRVLKSGLSADVYLKQMVRANSSILMLWAAFLSGATFAQDTPSVGSTLYRLEVSDPLIEPRSGACLASLGDGRVLAIGGSVDGVSSPTVEIYSQELGWQRTAPLSVARALHSCTSLADGRVMVAGGLNAAGPVGAIEIYDPALAEWRRLPQSMLARWRHTATLLTDGRVLLAGGQNDTRFFDTLEIVDPWFHTLTLLNSRLRSPRVGHAVAPLPGGSALVAGGFNTTGFIAPTDLISPAGQVTEGPRLPEGTAGLSATLLVDSRILLSGGTGAFGDTDIAFIYDPFLNSLAPAAAMPGRRTGHQALLLEGNGRVLIFGGTATESPVASTFLFDPASGAWESGPDLTGSSPVSSAIVAAGHLVALADTTLSLMYPALKLERSVVLPGMSARAAFVHIQDATEAMVSSMAIGSSPAVVVGQTLPVSTELTDLFSPGPETAGRRWVVAATLPGVPVLRAAFSQKARVRLTYDIRPSAPQAYESTAFGFTLTRDGENPDMAWPPAVALRTAGKAESNAASGFSLDVLNGQTPPVRALAGGEYEVSARLASLHDLYELDPVVSRGGLTVVRRTPQALDFVLPGGATIVGETRSVTATVRTGLPSSVPSPSGSVTVSRGGFVLGEVRLPSGGGGRGTANLLMGKAGSHPFEFRYVGDHNYSPVSSTSPAYAVQKGNLAMSLKPLKERYGVGELAAIDAVLTHPKVPGATPTGRIEPLPNPRGLVGTGAAVAGDPGNTGSIPVRVHAGTSTATLLNVPIGFAYSGDDNFNPRTATAVVDFVRSSPTLQFTPPTSVEVERTTSFEVIVKASAALVSPKPATGSIQIFSNGIFQRGFTLLPKGADAATTVTLGPHPDPGVYVYFVRYLGDLTYEDVDSPTFRVTVQ